MSDLFAPYELKGLSLKNRIVMPPMCQYSVDKEDGIPNDWHYVHYVSRAIGGTGFIIVEMTGVHPDGRITNRDTGIWSDSQIDAYRRITDGVHAYGSKIAVQLGHAGRKAVDAEPPVAPSAIPFDSKSKTPQALSKDGILELIEAFREGARRAVEAGFDTVEIHGAHGYLIHQFHSPLTNIRKDEYGQDPALFGEQVVKAVREVVPVDMPLIMRISAKEYVEGGYDANYALDICRRYKNAGVDMFHVSSGGEGPIGSNGGPNAGPAYQVDLAEFIRSELQVPVIAVGRLESYPEAQSIVAEERAELVAVGRGMLSDPYWALHAEEALGGVHNVPKPYERGIWKKG
ncbi:MULTISPECIES: NADH:flavin oxidoreductase/NADH oxidase [Paenibacillus]|uniref:NADPH dehydrogenase n=1 Tax=Paenibacillus odorifer TaxID=189426 RepID=A0A1R0Y2U4_9BACL|nr:MULTISPECIES: NADH:flavin oxidoreductase/NADH oxidase [Paenibacillus]AIQ36134.1 NADPH dehydrogenase [Paenibacillus sp. FSL R5-0345]OMD41656.1 NADPH dehydrogenase [Paenibacillus odorifer]